MIIAFCGIDGSGKTTQLKRLKNRLTLKGHKIYCTKQPTDWYRSDSRLREFLAGSIAEEGLLMRELALFSAADRLRHMQLELLPKVLEGNIVLSDRYVFSSYAYFMARGIDDKEWLMEINKFVTMPDLTFYIDVPAEVALKRIILRDGSSAKKEEKDINRLEKVRSIFLNQPWGEKQNYFMIDSTKDPEFVENEIFNITSKYLEEDNNAV